MINFWNLKITFLSLTTLNSPWSTKGFQSLPCKFCKKTENEGKYWCSTTNRHNVKICSAESCKADPYDHIIVRCHLWSAFDGNWNDFFLTEKRNSLLVPQCTTCSLYTMFSFLLKNDGHGGRTEKVLFLIQIILKTQCKTFLPPGELHVCEDGKCGQILLDSLRVISNHHWNTWSRIHWKVFVIFLFIEAWANAIPMETFQLSVCYQDTFVSLFIYDIKKYILVPACLVGRKTWFSRKRWVPNSKSAISPIIYLLQGDDYDPVHEGKLERVRNYSPVCPAWATYQNIAL